ncbi:MAG: hypothetical protein KDA44_10885 [Planctomycetales bacterium]|nr:hypothetical protein [Planctomycetales bacterium]
MSKLVLLAQIVNMAFFLTSMYAVVARKARLLISLLIWGMAFGNFCAYAGGLLWVPVKIVLIGVSLYCLVWSSTFARDLKRFVPIFTGAAVILLFSLTAMFLLPPEVSVAASGGQAFRPILHTYHYLSYLAVLPVCLAAFPNARSIALFLNQYLLACAFSSVVALGQLAAYALGLPFLPILRIGGRTSTVAAFSSDAGSKVLRLYALAGEPKQLAILLCPAVLACIVLAATGTPAERKRMRLLLVLIAPVFLMTFSTGAVFAALIAVAALAMMVGARMSKVATSIVLGLGVVAVVTALIVPFLMTSQVDFFDLLHERTVGRIMAERHERFELMILSFLWEEKPAGLVAGLGPGMYAYHIPGVFGFGGMGVAQINSGWIQLIVDLGLIGTLSIVFAIAHLLSVSAAQLRAQTAGGERGRAIHACLIAGLIAAACVNLGTFSLYSLALWFGVLSTSYLRLQVAQPQGQALHPAMPPGSYVRG